MAAISQTEFNVLTDSLGEAYATGLLALPATTPGTNLVTGAATVLAEVKALSDTKALVQLIKAASDYADNAAIAYMPVSTLFTPVLQVIRQNIGNDFVGYLEGFSPFGQVSKNFRDLLVTGSALVAASQFSTKYALAPQTDIRSVAVTGSGTGTQTAIGSINIATYGPAQFEAVVTGSTLGAANIIVTMTLTKYDGTSETKSVTLNSGSAAGTAVAVATTADRYVNCSAITFAGGTSGDAFKIRSKVSRTPAL